MLHWVDCVNVSQGSFITLDKTCLCGANSSHRWPSVAHLGRGRFRIGRKRGKTTTVAVDGVPSSFSGMGGSEESWSVTAA